jgi:hypothetical protein
MADRTDDAVVDGGSSGSISSAASSAGFVRYDPDYGVRGKLPGKKEWNRTEVE